MSDLVERIARDIAEEVGDPNWQNHAAAARRYIAEVRRFDVERGPSDAELTAFADAEIKARRWDYHDARTANRKGMEAAAKVRAEEVTE